MSDWPTMNDWWSIDDEILDCLRTGRVMTPAEIGNKLGLSESAAVSLLGLLAAQGKVRVRAVEGVEGGDA